jgi:Na+-translocating ferredoxin:NAD+ oxidoreductase RnfC subunit
MADAKEIARKNGIVGAGGAAFPTHIKLSGKAEILIANGAECEPLLYKDETVLHHFFDDFIKGLLLSKESVSAKKCIIGIKEKHKDLIEEIRQKIPKDVTICQLKDTYPSGDEFLLVYDATGRLIPKGGIPLDVGVVVQNVETLYNIGINKPVIEKFITVSGDVDEAVTLKVPIGIEWAQILKHLKIKTENKKFIIGGPMMGFVSDDLTMPVTKGDSGIVVLPENHPLIYKKSRTKQNIEKIAYTCDQCMRCSDLCPRDLLGHGVKPHKAMISVSMNLKEKIPYQASSLYCCECSLCTLYACPEDLDPSKVMILSRRALFEKGFRPKKEFIEINPMYHYRRTPTKLLVRRLGLEEFIKPHKFLDIKIDPQKIVLKLNQHRGEPSKPIVKKGQYVERGELVAETEEGKMGSRIFSSISGIVKVVDKEKIIVETK